LSTKAVLDFEVALANYTGANYSVGVGNATDGMEIFLEAIGIKQGDEVIISSHTMLATASAIKVAGGVPIPVIIPILKSQWLALRVMILLLLPQGMRHYLQEKLLST
jgi:dTDP-4-amino-4,6-dideoxygalactose transaminase